MSEELIKKIKYTYKEVSEIKDEQIQVQLDYAKLLVAKDIKTFVLDADFEEMGIVYLTCHLLYMNFSKVKSDGVSGGTNLVRAVGQLGKGYESSMYGQQYASLTNKEQSDTSISSGIVIL
ncbi:MAG: hypothetical protein RR795_01425 [Cetobacterium sp.]|uniref:DUF4054 domain-containing protein n=1 Tax=Cetobacterium sp. TaxID=2071632 RepID=UPI002FCB9764